VSTTVMDLVVVFALFVFMLALLCFGVATVFSVNKDLSYKIQRTSLSTFSALKLHLYAEVSNYCESLPSVLRKCGRGVWAEMTHVNSS